jgi:hypothetical protein
MEKVVVILLGVIAIAEAIAIAILVWKLRKLQWEKHVDEYIYRE